MDCLGQAKLKLSLMKYGQSEGLSSYNIRQVLKDRKGFLWIASQDGLARFDGRAFVHYSKQAPVKFQLSGADVRALIEDTLRHSLYVLPDRNGLDIVNTGNGEVVKHIAVPQYDSQDWNITMTACGGNLWIGSFCGLKIFNLEKQRFLALPRNMALKRSAAGKFEVNCLAKDRFGNVWVCYTGYGIVIYDGATFKEITEIPIKTIGDHNRSGDIRINDFAFLNDWKIVLATMQGLRSIEFDDHYRVRVNDRPVKQLIELNDTEIDAIKLIAPGRLLIAGDNNLYGFDELLDRYTVYDESLGQSESRWINYVQSIYQDGSEIWLSCQQGVAMMSTNASPFIKYYYDEKTGIKLEHLRSIAVLPDKDILCGLSSGLVLIGHADNRFKALDSLHLYHHLLPFGSGQVLLFREDGMYCLKAHQIVPVASIFPEFALYHTCSVNSHILLADTAVMLGTENDHGVLIWNYKRHYVKKLDMFSRPALASNSVNNIYRDKRGDFWVLSDKLITIIRHDLASCQTLRPANLELFFDMCEAGGAYWVTSYGNGLVEIDQQLKVKGLTGIRKGLCNDGVYNVFNVGDTSLLVTTNNGLAHYRIRQHTFKNYYAENGLQSNSFEEVTAVIDRGKIYAGGLNGFTIIDPGRLSVRMTPPLFYFKNVDVKLNTGRSLSRTDLNIQTLEVPSNWLQTTVSFAGINFAAPKRVSYKYRIREIDSNWVDNGYRDQLSLMGLPPAAYHLEVKAANEDDYWSRPKLLILHIDPKWFETIWFKIGALMLAAAILSAFYQYRIKQIRIQQGIRREIANDLHDDLGSNLNSIKIFTHLAIEKKSNTEYLKEIEKLITDTAAGLRDMLWVLEGTRDTVGDLIERIRKFAVPLAEARQIIFQCELDAGVDDLALSKIEKRNLLLIAKEAINNCFKYASCKSIRVSVKLSSGHKIYVDISDDGLGFNTQTQSGGYGLKNIKYRAEQIHYQINVRSTPGKGTSIIVNRK
ncbi:MAG: hypothetical protein JWP94_495 [Mucilaginibacter sp.]|nr:hypothetical protein [Mucilaginibacter sp.]